jgi:predicted ATPase with chaperone activity
LDRFNNQISKASRTIADLEGVEDLNGAHISGAI